MFKIMIFQKNLRERMININYEVVRLKRLKLLNYKHYWKNSKSYLK